MKVNTDGVLLGALLSADKPAAILDIGTGTGVIALMLAQRFPDAQIDAVEIDYDAAQTAQQNLENSIFTNRLKLYHSSFENFSTNSPEHKYDLIVSNPPFFLNALHNPEEKKVIARHASESLFENLTTFVKQHLKPSGQACFILPNVAATEVIERGLNKGLNLRKRINIRSSLIKPQHRSLIALGFDRVQPMEESFIIYESEKLYSEEYRDALKDFLTIF